MDQIKIGKVYRHFKGNYYFVEDVAYDSETKERMVVYKPLYNREDNRQLWVRPEKMFLEEIPERPDNITGQLQTKYNLVNYKLCNETSMKYLGGEYIIDIPIETLYCIDMEELNMGGSWNADFINFIRFFEEFILFKSC